MELTEQQKKFFDQLMQTAESGKSFDDAIAELVKGIEDKELIPDAMKAIAEVEKKHNELDADFQKKLAEMKRTVFDTNGNYRGMFPSADEARAFGLYGMAKLLGSKDAMAVIKSEYPAIYEKAQFDSGDASALIPQGFLATLINITETYGVYERNARYQPMSEASMPYPKVTGHLQMFHPAEGTAPTDGEMVVSAQPLAAKEGCVLTFISKIVDEDSAIAIGEMLAQDIGRAFALGHDSQGFNGDTAGGGEPNQFDGIIKKLHANAIKTGSGNTWGALTLDDFTEVAGMVITTGQDDKWYCSRQFFFQVMVPIQLAQGGSTTSNVRERPVPMFLGAEVEFTQVLPKATGTDAVQAIYGSLREGAVFGDRRQMGIESSDHYKFAERLRTVLGRRRYAIAVHGAGEDEAIAGLKTAA
ncbi:MAG: phage major capsid protein [Planctomycetota bacterium]